MNRIVVGNIIKCPVNKKLFMRTIIVEGKPMTAYSQYKEELGYKIVDKDGKEI